MRTMGGITYGATGVNYTIWMLQTSPRNSAIIFINHSRSECREAPVARVVFGLAKVCPHAAEGDIMGDISMSVTGVVDG